MNNEVLPDTITKISSTLLIPLWAKAVEMRHSNPLLKDPEAERMIQIIPSRLLRPRRPNR